MPGLKKRAFTGSLFLVLVLMALSLTIENWRQFGLELEATRWLGIAYLTVLIGAPLLIYPLAWHDGLRFRYRVALSFFPAFGWWLTELGVRLRWHSLPESLWLVASPFQIAHLVALSLAVAMAHLGYKLATRQQLHYQRGVLIVLGLALGVLLIPFSALPFLNGYEALFLSERYPERKTLPGRLGVGEVNPVQGDLPNIVVILSDDHRYDFSGYAGHPYVETPNLDRLAAQGVMFNRAYVTTSLCSPSRASILTGTTPYRHGVWNNFTPWSEQNRTFFEYLKAAGYRTGFVGKWHMPGGELPEIAGLDHFVSFTNMMGQGQYEWNPMIANGVNEESRTRYIATELTDRAVDWIKQVGSSPFVLYLAHKSVHGPFTPDRPDRGRYQSRDPGVPAESHLWSHQSKAQYTHGTPYALDSGIRRYSEAIFSMDREIGRLLDALEEMNLEDDTVVIYTSDNGYLWGEHQLIDKRWAYEESIRVPLIIRWHAAKVPAGNALNHIVANIDLAPTLLDLAGIPRPHYMEGQSLLPLLQAAEIEWREELLYSYIFEPPWPTPTSTALVTERYKIIETEWLGYELYDLHSDPQEQENLIYAEHTQGMERDLIDRLKAAKESHGS